MKSRDVINDVTNRRTVGMFLLVLTGHEPLNCLVAKCRHTDTDTLTDNKGHSKLSSQAIQ